MSGEWNGGAAASGWQPKGITAAEVATATGKNSHDVPALVAEVEQLRGQLQAVLDLCDAADRAADEAVDDGERLVPSLRVDRVRAAIEGAGS